MTKLRGFYFYSLLILTGGSSFCILEFIYRGWSHWTMLITGGVCSLLLYVISQQSEAGLWRRCFISMAVITTVEFIVGGIVNLKLGWGVWDYSMLPFQLMGQICLTFSFVWFLLSIPAIKLFELVHRAVSIPRSGI